MAIQATDAQVEALLARDPGGPINMLNLLKFKERAEYADGSEPELSGQEAYMRYGTAVAELVTNAGGEFVFGSAANTLVVGDGELEWDMVAIVKYPSVTAFKTMVDSPEYEAIHVHRDAGLAHQVLVQC